MTPLVEGPFGTPPLGVCEMSCVPVSRWEVVAVGGEAAAASAAAASVSAEASATARVAGRFRPPMTLNIVMTRSAARGVSPLDEQVLAAGAARDPHERINGRRGAQPRHRGG